MEMTGTEGKKKHININKCAGLSQDWMGGKYLFMSFVQVIPYGGEKTHKQNLPQKLRENPVNIFLVCVFVFVFLASQGILISRNVLPHADFAVLVLMCRGFGGNEVDTLGYTDLNAQIRRPPKTTLT